MLDSTFSFASRLIFPPLEISTLFTNQRMEIEKATFLSYVLAQPNTLPSYDMTSDEESQMEKWSNKESPTILYVMTANK